jgi:hypothetical protein
MPFQQAILLLEELVFAIALFYNTLWLCGGGSCRDETLVGDAQKEATMELGRVTLEAWKGGPDEKFALSILSDISATYERKEAESPQIGCAKSHKLLH